MHKRCFKLITFKWMITWLTATINSFTNKELLVNALHRLGSNPNIIYGVVRIGGLYDDQYLVQY